MITIIRNDKDARFAHDVYGIKIKEEKPIYKIIGTLNNEGICLFESPNFCEIAETFDYIINAIMDGKPFVTIRPPIANKCMTKEEFDSGEVYDFVTYKPKTNDRMINKDIYGRPLDVPPEPMSYPSSTNDWSVGDNKDYYAYQNALEHKMGTDDRKGFNNLYSPDVIDNRRKGDIL